MKRTKSIILKDADNDESAAPQSTDIERGKEIVSSASPLLTAMLEAKAE